MSLRTAGVGAWLGPAVRPRVSSPAMRQYANKAQQVANAIFCTVVLVRVEKCMISFLRKHRNETGTYGTKHQRQMDGIHFDPNC